MTVITSKIICSKHYRNFNVECDECCVIVIQSNKINMFLKNCIRCYESFQSGVANTQFCYNKYKMTCQKCNKIFTQSCGREQDFKKQCINRGCRSTNLKRELIVKESNCENCGDKFINKNNSKYCKSEKLKKCDICDSKVEYICDKSGAPKTCSNSCAAKINKNNTVYVDNRNRCYNCNIDIVKNKGKYCFKKYTKKCEFCFDDFSYECNRRINKTCSLNCKTALLNNWDIPKNLRIYFKNLDEWAKNFMIQNNRKPSYFDYKDFFTIDLLPPNNSRKFFNSNGKKYIKNCGYCEKTFETNFSYKKYCGGEHYMNCSFCNEEYKLDIIYEDIENIRQFCSSTCGTFNQLNSVIYKDKIQEYIKIDEWAINFIKENNRKPKRNDVYKYFNTSKINKKINKNNFDIKAKFSILEEMIENQLISLGFRIISVDERDKKAGLMDSHIFIKNSRPLKTLNNTNLELDFYNPSLGVAFEIQDFATHSVSFDNEPLFSGMNKKGPQYHLMKKKIAYEQLDIKLFDIWEDEITLGYSYNILIKIINSHMKK